MDDYTIEEKDKEVTGITVTYDDGSTKEIQQGCCVDLKNGSDDLSVELLNINLYLPKNYYFLTDDYGVCKTCLFRVSHIQNYKILA